MASVLKGYWDDFLGKHPDFKKSKSFKADVGPQLEKFDKARTEYSTLRDAMQAKAAEVVTLGTAAAATLKSYEAVVKELQAKDKTLAADLRKSSFDSNFTETYVKPYK